MLALVTFSIQNDKRMFKDINHLFSVSTTKPKESFNEFIWVIAVERNESLDL